MKFNRYATATERKACISHEYEDSDGYWIELKAGYEYDGCHGIHEDTRKEARECLKCVRICTCPECIADAQTVQQ